LVGYSLYSLGIEGIAELIAKGTVAGAEGTAVGFWKALFG
jgi:hypothetical protein